MLITYLPGILTEFHRMKIKKQISNKTSKVHSVSQINSFCICTLMIYILTLKFIDSEKIYSVKNCMDIKYSSR